MNEDPSRCGSPLVEFSIIMVLEMLALPIQFLANKIFLKGKYNSPTIRSL
jgi:hypothetical protein